MDHFCEDESITSGGQLLWICLTLQRSQPHVSSYHSLSSVHKLILTNDFINVSSTLWTKNWWYHSSFDQRTTHGLDGTWNSRSNRTLFCLVASWWSEVQWQKDILPPTLLHVYLWVIVNSKEPAKPLCVLQDFVQTGPQLLKASFYMSSSHLRRQAHPQGSR